MANLKPTFVEAPDYLFEKKDKIEFREEQKKAILDTEDYFCSLSEKQYKDKEADKRRFLWNAKMRFGKTLCALELARKLGEKDAKFAQKYGKPIRKILLLTHRPVVDAQWSEDFHKIFKKDLVHNEYGSRNASGQQHGKSVNELLRFVDKEKDNHIFYFASMQYLRRSSLVGGGDQDDDKKQILNYHWDLVIIDEAHEGTQTDRGQNVIDYLARPETLMLHLSGTPFNIYEGFSSNQIFSWDYPQEQKAKMEWNSDRGNNPYISLPRMNIMRYDMKGILKEYLQQDAEFKFSDFFKVIEGIDNPDAGKFVKEADVRRFIEKLREENEGNNFPFSNDEFRTYFRHTLWIVPGVKAAKALENLLKEDEVFGCDNFEIINVAGNNEDDETTEDALTKVKKRIEANEDSKYTITISCGRLTTGVTVKQWTAVLYMKGSDMTSAATYMQTIFRVQSPYVFTDENRHHLMKSECYAFDFAPDRALKMVAETAKFSTKATSNINKKSNGKKNAEEKAAEAAETERGKDIENLNEFLKYCDVLSLDNARLVNIDANELFAQLDKVYIDRVVRNGFDDNKLYDLTVLSQYDPEFFEDLKDLEQVGEKDKNPKYIPVDLSNLSPEEREIYEEWKRQKEELLRKAREARAKSREEFNKLWDSWTEEEREKYRQEIEDKKKKKEEQKRRINLLRIVSVRIPLLIYGANIKDEKEGITIDNITDIVDDASWEEFMPKSKGKVFSKPEFKKYKKCYNPVIFKEAGKKIREYTRDADSLHIEERIERIAEIFKTFKNPDKETVLTPWKVVNMHMADTLGGYCFFGPDMQSLNTEEHEEIIDGEKMRMVRVTPRFVDQGEVTNVCFKNINELSGSSKARLLEINSKTGFYPLYLTYSVFRPLFDEKWKKVCDNPDNFSVEEENTIWDQVLRENIFVICKTDMARNITQRTLRGFRKDKITGKDVQVNAVCPSWKVSKKDLAKAKIIKLHENEPVTNEESHNANLVEILRYKPELFETAVVTTEWWENVDKKAKIKLDRKIFGNMIKFNTVVGNPPYYLSDGGGGKGISGSPIYHLFTQSAKKLANSYVSMIIPARWYSGKTLEEFRKTMLTDKNISKFIDFPKSRDCFENAEVAGGICYFLIDKNNIIETCMFTSSINGHKEIKERNLNEINILIRYIQGINIIKNVKSKTKIFYSKTVFENKPFGLRTYIRGKDKPFKDSIILHSSDGISYIEKNQITKNSNLVDEYYKVYIGLLDPDRAGVNNSTQGKNVITKVKKIGPKEVITETYLMLDAIIDEVKAQRCVSYFKTKFVRSLISLSSTGLLYTKENFQFVPKMYYDERDEIEWDNSIEEIDKQLYAKYGLEQQEIDFIESMIKPME